MFLACTGALAAEGGATHAPPDATACHRWFVSALGGELTPVPEPRALSASECAGALTALWSDYKAAAIERGWDTEIAEVPNLRDLPSLATLQQMPRDQRPALPPLAPSVMPCGAETMPYLLFSRGERPAHGYPLFFQTHGGGSTDMALSGPHGWEVNTRDWRAQIPVCLFVLPEGMYFVPRMANDNKGRWWFTHNQIAFDRIIRLGILFREVDPDRIYMMGISEGAYGTEALTPFWADRFAGGCAMAGGAGGGERFHNLRNTAFRNDTGEQDTMFDRVTLARVAHDYLAKLKAEDPQGFDHLLNIQEGRGHSIDYGPGPAWISTKVRDPRPRIVRWFNYELDQQRRTDFAWLSLANAPKRDTLIVAEIDRTSNTITVSARVTPETIADDSPLKDTTTPPPLIARPVYTGNTLTLHLDDALVDLDRPVRVVVNGDEAFAGVVERRLANMAEDIVRHGDPGRVFAARIAIDLK